MIMYNIRIRARPGRRDDLLALLGDLAAEAEREPGTLLYLFNVVDDDPDLVVTYELFADAEALAAHQASTIMASVMPKFGDLVAEVDAKRGAPAFGKGLPPRA